MGAAGPSRLGNIMKSGQATVTGGPIAKISEEESLMFKRSWLVPALAVFLTTSAAFATLTPDEQKCQKQVGSQGGVFLKKALAAIEKCHNDISAGRLPLGTDCLAEPKTAAKITSYANKLKYRVTNKCTTAIVAGLAFGGQCNGVSTVQDLATCLIQTHEDQVNAWVNAAYATNTVLNADQKTCQKYAARAGLSFATKQHRILRSCKDRVSKGILPPATDCRAYSAVPITQAYGKLAANIAANCPDSTTATLAFGVPCAGAASGTALATCLLRSHGDGDEDMILVEYGIGSGGAALAEPITDTADCVGGPLSRCRVGDYLLKNDKIHVDLLKMPHHGSARNVAREFFEQVTADHYVISADGRFDNPDLEMLKMLTEARGAAEYTVYLTNKVPDVKTFFDTDLPKGRKYKVVVREDGKPSVRVAVGG